MNHRRIQAPVRTGVIGVGTIGSYHCRSISANDTMALTAVCDIVTERADTPAERYGAQPFYDHRSLLASGVCDAVVIATPHYSHTTIGIDALNAGMHVLVEKPLSVHVADCKRLLAAHRNPEQVFGLVYNQRTDPCYRTIRELLSNGTIGDLQRVSWIITTWYRPELYYQSSDWRATWAGEGGGLLMNQCMHQLDLLQWLCGMPEKINAFCGFGRYHAIEVEDDVCACLEYPSGATGMFQATTGEFPGTNRLELAGDRGRIVLDDSRLLVTRNDCSTRSLSRQATSIFAVPHCETEEITFPDHGGQHQEILDNFAGAILDGRDLIAPAADGIKAVALANALLYSGARTTTVYLPLDSAAYEDFLSGLIRTAVHTPKTAAARPATIDDTYLDNVLQSRWQSRS